MKSKEIGVKREWRRELFFSKTYAKQTSTPKKLMGAWLLSWTLMWKIRGTSWTSWKTGQTAGLNWAKRTTERSLIKRWCASLLDCSHTPHLSTASTDASLLYLFGNRSVYRIGQKLVVGDDCHNVTYRPVTVKYTQILRSLASTLEHVWKVILLYIFKRAQYKIEQCQSNVRINLRSFILRKLISVAAPRYEKA